ncbi:MAG: hypothetical protein ABII09_02390 [Planctomycetota bacterium]
MIRYILAVTAIAGFCVSVAFAQNQNEEKLLRDDYVLAGVDGRLVEGEGGKWLFEFESGISDGTAQLNAGQSLELLYSATLDKMTEDAKTRIEASYRLWGKVTKFKGSNFILPVYFLGLRKIDRPAGQSEKADSAKKATSINAPNDVLSIPDEIAAQLQTSEVLPAQEPPAGLQLKQDRIFANRVGRVVEKDGHYEFETDGLGQGLEKFRIELLPDQALEEAIVQSRGELNSVRFSVAGILTIYKGQQYLLLQKATRAYNYGNFGR